MELMCGINKVKFYFGLIIGMLVFIICIVFLSVYVKQFSLLIVLFASLVIILITSIPRIVIEYKTVIRLDENGVEFFNGSKTQKIMWNEILRLEYTGNKVFPVNERMLICLTTGEKKEINYNIQKYLKAWAFVLERCSSANISINIEEKLIKRLEKTNAK